MKSETASFKSLRSNIKNKWLNWLFSYLCAD